MTNEERIDVTPIMAERFLLRNTNNRKVRHPHVLNLAEAMKRGDFVFNGDTIVFDEKGDLLDGQHRLMAVVESNTTQKFLIVYNVSRDVQDTKDRNEGRTVSDALSQAGYGHSSHLAGAAKNLRAFEDGGLGWVNARGRFHPRDAKLVLKNHPELTESVAFIMNHRKGLNRVCRAWSTLSCLHYIFSAVDPAAADEFFARLSDGVGLGLTSPVLHLRERLIEDRASQSRLPMNHVKAFIIKAWNSHCQNRPMKILRWVKKEKFPKIEGFAYIQGKPVWPVG